MDDGMDGFSSARINGHVPRSPLGSFLRSASFQIYECYCQVSLCTIQSVIGLPNSNHIVKCPFCFHLADNDLRPKCCQDVMTDRWRIESTTVSENRGNKFCTPEVLPKPPVAVVMPGSSPSSASDLLCVYTTVSKYAGITAGKAGRHLQLDSLYAG